MYSGQRFGSWDVFYAKDKYQMVFGFKYHIPIPFQIYIFLNTFYIVDVDPNILSTTKLPVNLSCKTLQEHYLYWPWWHTDILIIPGCLVNISTNCFVPWGILRATCWVRRLLWSSLYFLNKASCCSRKIYRMAVSLL